MSPRGWKHFRTRPPGAFLDNIPEVLQALELDPQFKQLQGEQAAIRSQLELLMVTNGPDSRIVQSMKARDDSTKKRMEERRIELRDSTIALLKDNYEKAQSGLTIQLVSVQEQKNAADRSVSQLQDNLNTMEGLERRGEEPRIQDRPVRPPAWWNCTRRAHRPAGDDRAAGHPPAGTLHAQVDPDDPLGRHPGPGGGSGRDLPAGGHRHVHPEPLRRVPAVDLPMLGIVPHTDDLEEEIADPRLAFMTNPNSLIGEAFRQIRTCLQFSAPPRSSAACSSPARYPATAAGPSR